MSIKNLVEMIKRNGLLASMPQLEELYQVAIENELKLAESQREFRAADATIENLQMQVETLAAESASKSRCLGFFASVIKSGEEWTSVCQHEYSEALKNPATDAFLAEVRAQGVEMLREHPAIKLCSLTHVCDEFAAQIRKGVQS